MRTAGYLAVSLTSAAPLPAAEVRSPLQELRHPNITLVAGERREGPLAEGRIPIRVIERLRGDPDVPGEIELLVQAGDGALVEAGKTYLLFYTDVERVDFKPRTEVRRPDRRRLLHIEGADPAIFPDTPAMRELFDPGHVEFEQGPKFRDLVLEGMASDDPAMVDLWSAEWALRPATFSEVTEVEACLLRGIVENPDQRPAARARILTAGAGRTPPARGRWYAAGARTVLDETDPGQLAENAGLSQLIYASLRVAQNNPDAFGAPQLEKWLKAAPPLAENAALALRAIDPELEREAVRATIADLDTPEGTRAFLSEHLRRLELADERSR